MYLKKLEMLGFKSFADRTEFQFQPGMTAIVGPNGCGKSNVVDAFKWIFGEQSAKGMRGSEMKDVIFNGTQERKPTGFAEATVIFENSDRFLDVDYAEVAVTRRLYRSGESEYLINKQKARLKDIRELFMGTGVGQTSYSILEQGKIDVLLQSSNVDRRCIFEEAAGISKYLARKAEALRALLRVEENLTRLNDIIDEVEKRLNRVKAQASKARRHRTLSDRLRELRVRSTVEEYRESRAARVELSFRLYWSDLQERRLAAMSAEAERLVDAKSEERQRLIEQIKALNETMGQDRVLVERARERITQGQRRLAELDEEEARKAEDVRATLLGLQELQSRLEAERQELEAQRLEITSRRDDADRLAKELEEARRTRETVEGEVHQRKESLVSLMRDHSRASNRISALDSEIGNLKGQRDRLETSLSGFRAELDAVGTQIRSSEERARTIAASRDDVLSELEKQLHAEEGCQERLASVEAELSETVGQLHQLRSRYDVLKTLEDNLEGLGRGVADVLRKRETTQDLADVFGIVASLVKVDKRYARALEAALGARAQSLVVETQDGALGLLDFVRREEVGGVEAISLDRVDCVPLEHFPRQAGVFGALRENVEVPEEFSELFDRLLANVVLVEDFATALALSRNGLRPFRLVTLSGELVEPWGGLSITGETELGIISRRSEMDALQSAICEGDSDRDRLAAAQQELKRELQTVREAKDRLRAEETRLDRERLQVEGTLDRLRGEGQRLEREISVGSSELREFVAQLQARDTERASALEEVATIEERIRACEAVLVSLDADLQGAKGGELRCGEALNEARLRLAQAEKSEEGLRELVARQESNLTERRVHLESLRGEIAGIAQRREETRESIGTSEVELEQISARQEEDRRSLEAQESVDRKLKEEEHALRRSQETLRKEISRVQSERQSAQLREQEERHRRNTLAERMDEEYGLDLPALVELEEIVLSEEFRSGLPKADAPPDSGGNGAAGREKPKDADPQPEEDPFEKAGLPSECRYLLPDLTWDRDKAREEIREIQEKIRRLGAVNLEALDELKELEERSRFQLSQRADLQESEKNLRAIIGEINRTSRDLFLKTFEEVQLHFSELFRMCFGGGKAELVLEEGADVLEAGIDIVARPPGKKITRLSLMSGGEKTMTTIALLFAIFRARPSPFCILDEVDAPLDETNVRRFVVLLKDFLSRSQFIVVTHNKLTMAEAGTLYGVTMQERGVSKRVSVELASFDVERMEASVVR